MTIELIEILSIASPIVAVLVSIWVNQWLVDRKAKRERKEQVLRMLIENRFDTSRDEFIKAINSIPIIFRDHSEIIGLNREFYEAIEMDLKQGTITKRRDEILCSLILKICRELGYKTLEETDIRKVFTTKT